MKVEQNKINEIYQELQPLSDGASTQGLFGGDSLYGKTLKTTLDSEQATLFRTGDRASKASSATRPRWTSMVSRSAAAVMGLTSELDRALKLSILVTEETRPAEEPRPGESITRDCITPRFRRCPMAKYLRRSSTSPRCGVLERAVP